MSDVKITCCNCSMVFWMPQGFYDLRASDGKEWWCPAGHGQHFSESEVVKARRERDRLRQQLAEKDDEIASQRSMREAAERQAAAARGQVTKLRNRANAGLCPCCNRHFTNLERHMASKHAEEGARVVHLTRPAQRGAA